MNKKSWIVVICMIVILAIPTVVRYATKTDTYIDIGKEVIAQDEDSKQATIKKATATKSIPSSAIGIIEIENLDIRYPIYEGADSTQLNQGIGHLTETAGLMEQGNCVLAGHNGSSRGLYFTHLNRIRKGNEVRITRASDGMSRTYKVLSTKVVGDHDPSVRKQTKKERLTLFTCAYHGTRRFVVVCEPVEDDTQESVSSYTGSNE